MVASIDTGKSYIPINLYTLGFTYCTIVDIMPFNATVYIHYGPYEAVGIVDHRLSRLRGLQTCLSSDGHTVEFVKMEDRDGVELSVNGEIVFKCDINELEYGSDGELDPLCAKARKSVKEAY